MKTAKRLVGALAFALLTSATIASAQTTSTTTVGTPNTGLGGSTAANVLVLAGSAILALGGIAYLSRRSRVE